MHMHNAGRVRQEASNSGLVKAMDAGTDVSSDVINSHDSIMGTANSVVSWSWELSAR